METLHGHWSNRRCLESGKQGDTVSGEIQEVSYTMYKEVYLKS
jgi:hypothetical protein